VLAFVCLCVYVCVCLFVVHHIMIMCHTELLQALLVHDGLRATCCVVYFRAVSLTLEQRNQYCRTRNKRGQLHMRSNTSMPHKRTCQHAEGAPTAASSSLTFTSFPHTLWLAKQNSPSHFRMPGRRRDTDSCCALPPCKIAAQHL